MKFDLINYHIYYSLSWVLEDYEEEGCVTGKAPLFPLSDVHCHHP